MQPNSEGILPTTIENCVDREVSPGIWLITNPTFCPEVRQWRALANVGGALAVVQLRAFIDFDKLSEASINTCEHGRAGYCFDCVRKRHNQEMLDGKFDDVDDDYASTPHPSAYYNNDDRG